MFQFHLRARAKGDPVFFSHPHCPTASTGVRLAFSSRSARVQLAFNSSARRKPSKQRPACGRDTRSGLGIRRRLTVLSRRLGAGALHHLRVAPMAGLRAPRRQRRPVPGPQRRWIQGAGFFSISASAPLGFSRGNKRKTVAPFFFGGGAKSKKHVRRVNDCKLRIPASISGEYGE